MPPEARAREHLESVTRRLPGMQYAMADAAEVRFEFCGGRRDVGAALPVTSATAFMAASSTKAVTAVAVLQLAGRGEVKLDASLSAYYPEHPYGSGVTVRQLLNHTSGVPSPMPINWLHRIDTEGFDEDGALTEVMRAHPHLSFPAGDRYAYSNLSYWLLGKVIQRVSGLSFEEYTRREIFEPMGVTPGEMSWVVSDLSQFARGYQRHWSAMGLFTRLAVRNDFLDGTDGRWLRFSRVYMNGPPYGGIIGNARGFCRFLQDQLRPESVLIGPEEMKALFSEQRDAHNRELPTTLGWRRGELGGVTYYGKPGGGPGFHSNIRIYPQRGIATAWFVNQLEVSEAKILQFGDAVDRHWLV
jgi:D-alanyl-D-alanine carboxypeptidase